MGDTVSGHKRLNMTLTNNDIRGPNHVAVTCPDASDMRVCGIAAHMGRRFGASSNGLESATAKWDQYVKSDRRLCLDSA